MVEGAEVGGGSVLNGGVTGTLETGEGGGLLN